jgi:hypothetical protein
VQFEQPEKCLLFSSQSIKLEPHNLLKMVTIGWILAGDIKIKKIKKNQKNEKIKKIHN